MSAWNGIRSSVSQSYPAYGQDSNCTLSESALNDMAAQANATSASINAAAALLAK